VARYAGNRARLLAGLPALGLAGLAPADGAFYVYADIGHLTDDSLDWSRRLLATSGIAVTPGVDFDVAQGHRYVRFSFAGPLADIDEALERLSTALTA
jgi:aspartate/methionine/tyrosine aminotransferase